MKKIINIIIILVLLCQSVPVSAIDNSLEIVYTDRNSDLGSPPVESSIEKNLDTGIIEPIAPTGEAETDKDITTFEKEDESTIEATENSSEEPISDGTEKKVESYASTVKWGTSIVSINGDSATVKSGTLSGHYPKELYGVKHLTLDNGVKFPDDCSSLFGYVGIGKEEVLLENISGLDLVDTSNVQNMSHMFYAAHNLKSLNLSKFDTSNVTKMDYMFTNLDSIKNLNVSTFNTSSVTNMNWMFRGTKSVTSLDVSNFITSKVTRMSYMFADMSEMVEIKGLEAFDTSKVTKMDYMFSYTSNVKSFDLSSFDTRNVESMNSMFKRDSKIESLKIGKNTKLKADIKLSVSKSSGYSKNWTLKGSEPGKISLSDIEMGSDKPSNNPGEYVWEEKQPDVYGYIEVYYEEENEYGKKLLDTKRIEGIVGQSYDVTKEKDTKIEGYTLISDPKNMTGVFKTSGQTIHFLYKKTVKDKITASPKNQKLFLGQNINEISTYDLVKDVKVGNRDLTTDEYTVSMQNTVPTGTVGDKTGKVLITYKKDPTAVLSLDVPVEILWGNSVVYGGYDYYGTGRTVGTFTLSTGTSPSISAAQGNDDDNKQIHSNFPNQQYYTFDWFDLSDKQSLLMNENDKGSTYIQANGNDLKKDKLKEWGTNQKQAVNYGDIVRAWHREVGKNWLYENEEKQNYNDGKKSVYYEITKTGFQPLRVNQLKVRDDILIDKYTSETELDKDIKANPSDYYENPNNYENVNVVGFTKYPDTSKSGKQPATIRFEETLKSGKKVQYDYHIQVNVDDKWVNVTIPTKMLFFSDMKSGKKDKVISESYSITNNSDNTSLGVEMASFSVAKDSEVTYLSPTEKDPVDENKLRLNLLVNGQPKVQGLTNETKPTHLIDLDVKKSTNLTFEGQYFNAKSEDSPEAKSSMVLKFNIKK